MRQPLSDQINFDTFDIENFRGQDQYEIFLEEFKSVLEKAKELKKFLIVDNDFITILQIKNLRISILDSGKIIFKGEEREDMVRKLFNELFN